VSRRALVLVAAALALPACSWFKSPNKDPVEPPAELTDFDQTLPVERVWERDLGDGGGKAGLRLRPAFANDRIYVSDIEGRVSALDAGSGAVAWTADLGEGVATTPGVGDDLVVVGTLDGAIVALDQSDGTERWRTQASSEVIAAPAIRDGLVVARSHDGRLFGLSAADGERRWVFDRGVPLLSLRGNGTPVIDGDTVYVGYDNGKVFALRTEDGVAKWEQSLAQSEGRTELERMIDVDGEMAFDDDQIYAVTYRGQVGAVARDNGRPLWSRDMSSYGGLAKSGNRLYTVDSDGVLWALDANGGATVWKQGGLLHRYLSTPAVVGDYVVVGDLEGFVHWYRAETGDLLARQRVGKDEIRTAPLVVGNTVYIANSDGQIAALRPGG
jgi:outer membrane protein assembly factor BamB